MFRRFNKVAFFALAAGLFIACDDDADQKNLRPSISYNALDTAVAYADQFLDESNTTTVDVTSGNTLHKMFQGLNYYNSSSISGNTQIDPAKLDALFTNTGNAFVDVATSTVSITGDELNSSGLSIKDHVATSLAADETQTVVNYFGGLFEDIGTASLSIGQAGSKGVAGKIETYLVNAKGIEVTQVIQKSLIGALELDYIGNYLMDEGLNADNSTLVAEENYTALEHNWDIAYGLLTLNPIYLRGATNDKRKTVEFAAGAYIWEYNKESYAKIYASFLIGRAAIVNNDRDELQQQATFIRTEFEKALANAALGYLGKWQNETTEAKRVHAFGEGLGFIYALRFAKIHGADAEFSDHIIEELTGSEFGYWDLTVTKINHAADEIKERFNL
jgi:hypothetical protein